MRDKGRKRRGTKQDKRETSGDKYLNESLWWNKIPSLRKEEGIQRETSGRQGCDTEKIMIVSFKH